MGIQKVTIIVPSYNAGRWISECLLSIQRQTFGDWLCKIYDDGSTDNTRRIAEEIAKTDKRFVVIPDDKNIGTPKRVTRAYSEVSSEFFCQVDADDTIPPNAIETLYNTLYACQENVGVAYSDYISMTEQGEPKVEDKHFTNRCRKVFSLRRMQSHGFCSFQLRLIRTSAYKRGSGVAQSIKTGEDFSLAMSLAEVCQFVHVRRKLYNYRQHESQTCRNKEHLLEHTCRGIMEESQKKKASPDFSVIIPYYGVDDLFALRQWCQHITTKNVMLVVISDIPDDADLQECKQYSHHRLEIIPERDDENTDYGKLVSDMLGGKPYYMFDESLVPGIGVMDDIANRKSISIVTLEPRSSWLLQSGTIGFEAVSYLDEIPVESFGNDERGKSVLYRLTRESKYGT